MLLLFSIIECSLGHYGHNCDKSCHGCLSDYCDREFGVCTNTTGCKPGRLPGGTPGRLKCDKGISKICFIFSVFELDIDISEVF